MQKWARGIIELEPEKHRFPQYTSHDLTNITDPETNKISKETVMDFKRVLKLLRK